MTKFLDHAQMEARSGDGGNGMVAWRRDKYEPNGGPAGGNGGRGGAVYIEATPDLNTLIDFRFKNKFAAENGAKGGPKSMHGKAGHDLTIKVPMGTVVRDAKTKKIVADLTEANQRVLVAEGGKGGRGNAVLATASHRAPHWCEPGQPGVFRELELELKILADVGIIGLPNAGKSTLLSVISAAKPKIADYPFSTLEPSLGVVRIDENRSFVAADIPGLIEGASRGVGLGHDFLRHIERTRLLLHLVDLTSTQIEKDIETIENELRNYDAKLAELPKILVLNKVDILSQKEAELKSKEVTVRFNDKFIDVRSISAATKSGVLSLCNKVDEELVKLPKAGPIQQAQLIEDEQARERPDERFTISHHKNAFHIDSDKVRRLVEVTNLKDPLSLYHLHNVLRAMGIIDELIRQGAKPGSEITAGGISFIFGQDVA